MTLKHHHLMDEDPDLDRTLREGRKRRGTSRMTEE
jgi:hypothetical protein